MKNKYTKLSVFYSLYKQRAESIHLQEDDIHRIERWNPIKCIQCNSQVYCSTKYTMMKGKKEDILMAASAKDLVTILMA
jgi:hypothetical protein